MSPESNGARVAGDLGSWRWVYLRFDLSPSGKSGGKEKVTKSEQFAALPGVGAVGQDCRHSSGYEKERRADRAAGAFPSRHRRRATASPSAEATPPTSAERPRPPLRIGSARPVFQVGAQPRLAW